MTPKDITCYMQVYMASVPAELYVIEADAIHNVLHTPCHLRAGLLDILANWIMLSATIKSIVLIPSFTECCRFSLKISKETWEKSY